MDISTLEKNVFYKIDQLEKKVKKLEYKLSSYKDQQEREKLITQNHLLRVKNGEDLSDDFLTNKRTYSDLSPEKAYRLYQDESSNFYLLDVSDKSYAPDFVLELSFRINEIPNRSVPIMIISENGTNSILACELLNEMGYFNINNISGGYKFWPAAKVKTPLSA